MKCSVCSYMEEARRFRMLKKASVTGYPSTYEKSDIPEATASFKASNGMTVYICNQHLTANIKALDDLVIKQKERKYSL